MEIRLENSAKGTKVLLDGKHKKTIPTKLATVYMICEKEIDYNKKRLSDKERELLTRTLLYSDYLLEIKKKDKYLYELIQNATPTTARKVITREKERLELQLDNGMKITCPSLRLFNLLPRTSDFYSNF